MGGASAVGRRRPASICDLEHCRHQKALDTGDLAVEVPRIEFFAPHDLVNLPKLCHHEFRCAKCCGKCGVLQLSTRVSDPIGGDRFVIEC